MSRGKRWGLTGTGVVATVAAGVATNQVEGPWWAQVGWFAAAMTCVGVGLWVTRKVSSPEEGTAPVEAATTSAETPAAPVRVEIAVSPSGALSLTGPVAASAQGREPDSAASSVVVGDIPRRPMAFQPREGLMRELEEAAGSGRAVVCALTGARGVGKTQIAAAYARRRAEEGWPLVAWVNAETDDQLLAGLDAVAAAVGIAVAGEDAEQGARRLKQWLSRQSGPCLLVLDNLTGTEVAAGLLPVLGSVQVVISSNRRQVQALGVAVPVEVFTVDEAVAFLQERSGRADEQGALLLAQEVERLPLALAQAAWVIRSQHLDYATYVRRLRSVSLERMLPTVPGEGYPHGAAQAVLLSLTQLGSGVRVRVERGLLEVLAVLSPAGVPRSWLYRITAYPVLAGKVGGDGAVRVDAAIGVLADASLIVVSVDGSSVSMHRFIQAVVRDATRKKGRLDEVLSAVAEWVRACGPSLERVVQDRGDRESFVEQAAALHQHVTAQEFGSTVEFVVRVLSLQDLAGRYLVAAGDLARAIPLLEQNLTDRIRLHGEEHPDILTSRNNLASAYRSAGDLARAIPLLEQNLTDRIRLHGEEHPDILTSRNNLASAYESAGDLARAIPLLEQNLTDRIRLHGEEHPDTLSSRNNLASAYESAGDLARAIPLYEQNLTDRIRVLGKEHPYTLSSRNNLAYAYELAGDLARAIPLHEQNLTDSIRVLGEEHPYTLSSRNNLASAYQAAGDLARAIPLHEQSLTDSIRVLGEEHPDTLSSRNNLASAYQAAGDLARAIPLHEQSLTDSIRVLGEEHPDTLSSRNNLASAYCSAGDLARAIPLLEQNLTDSIRVLGEEHPDTLSSRNNLASVYCSAGDLARAIPLLEQNLTECIRVLGAGHPITMTVRNNLTAARDER
ncbi:tetratricopeptide repeat protein [Streptosporangium nondiastaticum]|uniref:tetratricopeptide repeat protein n=1 Tax=Streptosporangium nondiastaticum TaxID=35764 RepID=UPI0031F87654